MNTISSKLGKRPASASSSSLSAKKAASNLAAMNKKPTQKFIGYGKKTNLANNSGITDVASKLDGSDSYGVSADELIARSAENLKNKTDYNPFAKLDRGHDVLFARGTSEEEKANYLRTQEEQNQLADGSASSFSNYTTLSAQDEHANEKVSDKKVIINADLFKKR
jgi:hypothetical protein